MLLIVSAAVPVLVMVTYCDALVVPTLTAPNETIVGDSVTGPVGATPVPLSVIDCGELLALSVMVIAAVMAPAVVGPKCPWMVQLAPIARVFPQEFAKTNCDALVPVTAMLVMETATVPVLVMVTVCVPLIVPSLTEPKARFVDESVTGGATPVPVRATVWGDVVALSVMVTLAVIAPGAVGWKWL